MTNPFRGAAAAALILAVPMVALAQTTTPASAPARSTAKAAPPKATPYASAFDGYRRFDDQKVQPWREANDTVGRIGGWRAYAREVSGPPNADLPNADPPNAVQPGADQPTPKKP